MDTTYIWTQYESCIQRGFDKSEISKIVNNATSTRCGRVDADTTSTVSEHLEKQLAFCEPGISCQVLLSCKRMRSDLAENSVTTMPCSQGVPIFVLCTSVNL